MTTTTRISLAWAAVALGVAVGAPAASAQAPQRDPPPTAPQPAATPARPQPQAAPPTPAPGAASAAAARGAAAPSEPLRPASRASALPPDSVHPAAAAAPAVPAANAVARCRDGSYVADAGSCAARGGVVVLLLQPAGSRPAPPRPATSAMTARPVAAAESPAPAGATMRCKDGTYLTGEADATRCASNGGLAAILAAPRPVPAGPPQPRRP